MGTKSCQQQHRADNKGHRVEDERTQRSRRHGKRVRQLLSQDQKFRCEACTSVNYNGRYKQEKKEQKPTARFFATSSPLPGIRRHPESLCACASSPASSYGRP